MSQSTARRSSPALRVIREDGACTVADLIAALMKHDPRAIVLWNGNGSIVAHGIEANLRAHPVRQINEQLYSTIGADRPIKAVLIDVMDPQ